MGVFCVLLVVFASFLLLEVEALGMREGRGGGTT